MMESIDAQSTLKNYVDSMPGCLQARNITLSVWCLQQPLAQRVKPITILLSTSFRNVFFALCFTKKNGICKLWFKAKAFVVTIPMHQKYSISG